MELKPCPFCGSAALDDKTIGGTRWISCGNEKCAGWGVEARTPEAWNQRVPTPEYVGRSKWVKCADGEGTPGANPLRIAEALAGGPEAFFCIYKGDFYEYRVEVPPLDSEFISPNEEKS